MARRYRFHLVIVLLLASAGAVSAYAVHLSARLADSDSQLRPLQVENVELKLRLKRADETIQRQAEFQRTALQPALENARVISELSQVDQNPPRLKDDDQ